MAETMMALGSFRFSADTAPFASLQRTTAYQWASQNRLGRLPARQFTGPGDESINLDGVIYPHYKGGLGQLEKLRAEAGKGEALMVTDAGGNVGGKWCIERVEETRRVLFADGTPRKVEFRLSLTRYGEDQ